MSNFFHGLMEYFFDNGEPGEFKQHIPAMSLENDNPVEYFYEPVYAPKPETGLALYRDGWPVILYNILNDVVEAEEVSNEKS